jgi:hypothetical protein
VEAYVSSGRLGAAVVPKGTATKPANSTADKAAALKRDAPVGTRIILRGVSLRRVKHDRPEAVAGIHRYKADTLMENG